MGAVFSNTTSSIHHRADLRTPCAAMIQKDEVRDILPVFSDRPASPGPARTRFVVSLQNSLVLHSLEGRTCAGPHPCARSLRIHGASRDRISIPNSKAVGALKVALYVAGTVFPTGEEPVRNQRLFPLLLGKLTDILVQFLSSAPPSARALQDQIQIQDLSGLSLRPAPFVTLFSRAILALHRHPTAPLFSRRCATGEVPNSLVY
ncbi:hypothetical protein B0H15DRAFT_42266 [Mycena belliarum]|uniref:Uncharacterized protein n=1 Tax=Mycena belliarum TaxID=1033014 RepID=A0AAD6XEW1_9AGAR|nr:hypothetical protein B0H15DRAFT_42266 [Mycena belliae]